MFCWFIWVFDLCYAVAKSLYCVTIKDCVLELPVKKYQ